MKSWVRIVKVVYANMWVDRPKWYLGVFFLIYMYYAVTSYLNLKAWQVEKADRLAKIGTEYVPSLWFPLSAVVVITVMWFVLLPFTLAWIDSRNGTPRLAKLLRGYNAGE